MIQAQMDSLPGDLIRSQAAKAADDIVKSKAQEGLALLQYELDDIINLQLAMNSANHGYNYKKIPQDLINKLTVTNKTEDESKPQYAIVMPSFEVAKMEKEIVDLFMLAFDNVNKKMMNR